MSEQVTNHNTIIQTMKEPNGSSKTEKHSALKENQSNSESLNWINSMLGMVKEKTSELEERSIEFF